MSNTFYNEILIEHNLHPTHKHELPDANLVLEGVNPSCGDDIWLKLKVENDEIVDGAFVGDGCAISQASADMMLDLIIGKKKDEALRLLLFSTSMVAGAHTCCHNSAQKCGCKRGYYTQYYGDKGQVHATQHRAVLPGSRLQTQLRASSLTMVRTISWKIVPMVV